MAEKPIDLELKFDGPPVKALNGAPADAIIATLTAIQRMVYIIGMRAEGRVLSERLKPSIKVKRDYAVVCRAPQAGSHIQPFSIESDTGQVTSAALSAREKLLGALKAFDSDSESAAEKAIPSARERWFLARAASGLLPAEDSQLDITIRSGPRGPFTFRAARARRLLKSYEVAPPPPIDEESVAGKLRAIDYGQTILTIKPGTDPAFRLDYPLPLEGWLQANVRKRLRFTGRPKLNPRGDISSFSEIYSVSELEPNIDAIDTFDCDGVKVTTAKSLSLPVTVLWPERLFTFIDTKLGIDVVVQDVNELRDSVLSELNFVWLHYALANDEDLDEDAQQVKRNLLQRFEWRNQ